MKVRLDQIGDEPFTWDIRQEVPPERLEREDVVALSPIHWQGRIRRLDMGFLLEAGLDYEQTLSCQRCLEPVTEPVSAEIDLMVQTAETGDALAGELELDEEDFGVYSVDGEELDLDPLLIEQIQLAVPMRPVCREDCKGLCGSCGQNLNAGACDCDTGVTDPRWSGLAALKDQLSEAQGGGGSDDD